MKSQNLLDDKNSRLVEQCAQGSCGISFIGGFQAEAGKVSPGMLYEQRIGLDPWVPSNPLILWGFSVCEAFKSLFPCF